MELYNFIAQNKLVAISRGVYGNDLVKAVEAVSRGGIKLLEITFDQKSATALKDTPDSIAMVKDKFKDAFCVGAGTVVTKEQAQAAKDAGADFILAPNTDVEVIKYAKSIGLFVVPGALTPSEIVTAYNAGADIVKLFPAANFGIEYIKAIRAPINHIPLMAVGGVDVNNVKSLLDNGCMSAGIGSSIINAKKVKEGLFDDIEKVTKEFVKAIAN